VHVAGIAFGIYLLFLKICLSPKLLQSRNYDGHFDGTLKMSTYLIPRVGTFGWIDKNSNKLGSWKKCMGPHWHQLIVKVVSTLFKYKILGGILG
jgi:hypothetical protein